MAYENDEQQLDSEPPGRPRNSWLSFLSKDMKSVCIPDAMVMADDRMRWKRVIAEHATPR